MDDIIQLNIGGVKYITTKQTLLVKDSYFDALLSGRMKTGLTINDALFIDRDGSIFGYVLNYLRNLDTWEPPNDPDILIALLPEINYFALPGMLDQIKKMVKPVLLPFEVYLQLKGEWVTAVTYGMDCPDLLISSLNATVAPGTAIIPGILSTCSLDRCSVITTLLSRNTLYYIDQYVINNENVATILFRDVTDTPQLNRLRSKLYSP